DGDVEPAERLDGVGHHAVDLGVVAAVGHDRDGLAALLADLSDDGLGLVGPHVVDRHCSAGACEPPCDLATDAGARPTDEHRLSAVVDHDAGHGSSTTLIAPAARSFATRNASATSSSGNRCVISVRAMSGCSASIAATSSVSRTPSWRP